MSNELISLQISQELVKPVIEMKIKEAIASALGGPDALIKGVVDKVFNQKVNENGVVSSYSSENKYNWFDAIVSKQIKEAIEGELKKQIAESSEQIKEALVAQIRTKKGSSQIAAALLDGLDGTFKNSWTSKIELKMDQRIKD